MRIEIDGATYTALLNLDFAPEADVVGASLPIDEFTADIVTGDAVAIGQMAKLYDDLGALWANYWITYAEHIDEQTLRVTARSVVMLLDRVTMPARMYTGEALADVLDDLMALPTSAEGITIPLKYVLDESFDGQTITGFCPEQTARERLTWLLLVIGGYARASFTEDIRILSLGQSPALIPMDRTYWRPSIEYSDHVTAVKAKAYTFTEGAPETTDEYVTDADGVTYIVTAQPATLFNPNAPAGVPENVVEVEGVYLIHAGNVANILSSLARKYFARARVELEAIDNAEYLPGDKVTVYGGGASMFTGYIEAAEFAFGFQAKAALRVIVSEESTGASLYILYLYEEEEIGFAVYVFPAGYNYAIGNPYIDLTRDDHRLVFRPLEAVTTGTMPEWGDTAIVENEIALDLFEGIVHILSVDGIAEEITETNNDIITFAIE